VILMARRREADAAFVEATRRKRIWLAMTRDARAWIMRHRAGVIVGGGFAAGLTTSLLPVAPLLRLASAFVGTLSLMLEGPFLRLLAASHREASTREATDTTVPTS